ncbi:HAMP domain-containing sensor histidine kinase [Bosea sp. BK604]|uniref:sensor histidine kinase n=1 Tax=Bosea sp. BK604 TaxID=2512180 RepID=UPI001051E792|nr:HAMP domain-containing sensor histidine kinase [Bosea sp. BK604]TCR63379.1 signal transduction histidine kinase [Bosea sp. BK604]
MIRLLTQLLPARAVTQLAVIVLGAFVLVNLVTAVMLLVLLPRELRRPPEFPYVVELATIARQIHAARTAEARAVVLDAALAAQPRLSRLPSSATASNRQLPPPDSAMVAALAAQLSGIAEVLPLDRPDAATPGPPGIGLRFPEGTGIAMAPPEMMRPPGGGAIIVQLLVTLATLATLIALLTLWAARAVVSPLSRLAEAADRFDPDRGGEITVERGPLEVKRLASALSTMAARIRRLVDERTRMLAAVSHDLRTLITRLRLRAEEIANPGRRRAMLADLALMERMANDALSFLREGRASGNMVATDLPALLQTICDDFADLGHDVVYVGPDRVSALCDADQMTRAVTNLVDNALKFGGKAVVRLDDGDEGSVAVSVEDDGPGIAPAERDKVLEPFYRSDAARTLRDDGGFGLGLAIARAIAEAHRGQLSLRGRSGGGLEARISWPRGGRYP